MKVNTDSPSDVNAISKQEIKDVQKPDKDNKFKSLSQASTKSKCYRCGNPMHLANNPSCPARNVTCHKCGRRGHLARVCRDIRE